MEAQARKVAAQAVIELTDRLARAEQENTALRQRLHESRRLSKVTQGNPPFPSAASDSAFT